MPAPKNKGTAPPPSRDDIDRTVETVEKRKRSPSPSKVYSKYFDQQISYSKCITILDT